MKLKFKLPMISISPRFTSRKFLFALLSAFVAFGNYYYAWGFSAEEIWQTIAPLLAFIGIEGLADLKERGTGK